MSKKLFAVLTFFVSLFVFSSPALADEEVRKIEADTKLKGFTQTEWKDNLESGEIIFGPGDKLQLRLIVANKGNRNQTNLKVKVTASPSLTIDSPLAYIIPEIGAGSEYSRFFTVTVKNKEAVNKVLTAAAIRFDVKSEIGTEASDYSNLFTNNGIKEASASGKTLPATGAASLILMGTLASFGLGTFAFALRKASRGY